MYVLPNIKHAVNLSEKTYFKCDTLEQVHARTHSSTTKAWC